MYGTVGRMKVKPGKFDELVALMKEDTREIDGAINYYLYKLDGNPDEAILAVVFRDKQSYMANADDPSQDDNYRKMVALLEGPPSWDDGEIVASQR